jgi:hypothetical protein
MSARKAATCAWFNAAAFAQPALGTFGTSPRNLLRAPSYFNPNWSVGRSFKITERLSAQLRGDFFDALNNPHFNAPGSSFANSTTFCKITTAGDPKSSSSHCAFGISRKDVVRIGGYNRSK